MLNTSAFSKGLSCRYPSFGRRTHHEPQYPSPQSTASSSAVSVHNPATGPTPSPNNFPAVFYLDWNIFQRCQVEIPKPNLPLPSNISNLIGNAESWENIATEHFSTTHTWMPIISKKSFYEYIRNPSGQIRSDYALLILVMDLVCWIPETNDPRTSTYLAAKSFYRPGDSRIGFAPDFASRDTDCVFRIRTCDLSIRCCLDRGMCEVWMRFGNQLGCQVPNEEAVLLGRRR
jgi:hypothetical protein